MTLFILACNSSNKKDIKENKEEIYRGKELLKFLKSESIPFSKNSNILIIPTIFCGSCVNKANNMINKNEHIELIILSTDKDGDFMILSKKQKNHLVNARKLEQAGLAFSSPRYFEIRNSVVVSSKSL